MFIFEMNSLLFWSAIMLTFAGFRLRQARRESNFRRFAFKNHCREAPRLTSKLPWGLDRLWHMLVLTSQKADIMETVMMPSFAEHGWTHSSTGLLGHEVIMTAEPENLRAIFSAQFQDFLTGDNRAGAFGYMVGRCIFTTDGPFWEHSRALFRPHFARGEINDLEATESAVQDLLYVLMAHRTHRKKGDDGTDKEPMGRWTSIVDMEELFLRFTLDTGTEFIFGANVKSQLAAMLGDGIDSGDTDVGVGLDDLTRVAADKAGGDMTFTQAFHVASMEVTKRARLQSLYWLVNSRKGRQAVRYLQRFIDHLVHEQLHRGGKELADAKKGKLTLLRATAQYTQDPIELRDQTLFMLTASRDTTAAMLSWMFLMLAKHPAVFAKLRDEILKQFGPHENPQQITFYRLKKCKYLQWTMFETLRMFPPGPLNSRVAARDTTLPVGGGPDGSSPIALRKGQAVVMCVYAMHRRPDLWGDDATEFRPERWDGRKSDWSFLPFSGGPRTCLGSEF